MKQNQKEIVIMRRPKFEPKCGVCRTFRAHRNFKERIMLSTYFRPEGKESIDEILKSFGYPVSRASVYIHLKKHQGIERAEVSAEHALSPSGVIKQTLMGELVEASSTDPHERLLDRLIAEGDALLDEGKLTLTTNQILQAIKTKSDIIGKNKDRKVDALRALFTGAAPKKDETPTLPDM